MSDGEEKRSESMLAIVVVGAFFMASNKNIEEKIEEEVEEEDREVRRGSCHAETLFKDPIN